MKSIGVNNMIDILCGKNYIYMPSNDKKTIKKMLIGHSIEKVYEYKEKLQQDLSFEEISKMFREILYDEWKELKDDDAIHCYQLTRDMVDIFTQMVNGRKFDENYLKNKVRW